MAWCAAASRAGAGGEAGNAAAAGGGLANALLVLRSVAVLMKRVSLMIQKPPPWGTTMKHLLKCRMDSFSLVSLSLKSPVTVNVIKLGLVKGTSRVKVLRSCSVLGSFDK